MCWAAGIYLFVSKLTICYAANFITISSTRFGLEYFSLFKKIFLNSQLLPLFNLTVKCPLNSLTILYFIPKLNTFPSIHHPESNTHD